MTNKNDKILAPIKGRIVQFIENQKIEKKFFFENLEVASSNFRGQALYSEVSADIVAKILTLYPNSNAEWFLLGKGNMMKNEKKKELNQSILGHNNTMVGNDLITDNNLAIKVLMSQIEDCKKIIEEKDSQINKLLNLISYEKK